MRAYMILVATGLFMLGAQPALAVNKCKMPDGSTVYSDLPCPSSSQAAEGPDLTNAGRSRSAPASGRPEASGGSFPAVEPDPALSGPPQAEPLLDLYRRWIDAERLAFATGRIALAGPISQLQQLQREARATMVADCMAPAQASLIELIGQSTDAILRFMGKEEVTAMVYQLTHRPKLIPKFENAVKSAVCE